MGSDVMFKMPTDYDKYYLAARDENQEYKQEQLSQGITLNRELRIQLWKHGKMWFGPTMRREFYLLASNEPKQKSVKQDETDDNLCVICMDNESAYACIPCGHRCVCGPECPMLAGEDLSEYLKENKCPMCRKPVQQAMQVFLRRRLFSANSA